MGKKGDLIKKLVGEGYTSKQIKDIARRQNIILSRQLINHYNKKDKTMTTTMITKPQNKPFSKLTGWFYNDTEALSIDTALQIDVSDEYLDVSSKAKLNAVLSMTAKAKYVAIFLILAGIFLISAISFVSVSHIWEVLASIKPSNVANLEFSADLFHYSALAFTIITDISLVYMIFVNLLSLFASTSKVNVKPIILLIGVLNALYIVHYFPNLDAGFRSLAVNVLTYTSVVFLPVAFIVTILKLKSSIEYSIASFVAISVKVDTYQALLSSASVKATGDTEQNSTSVNLQRTVQAMADAGIKKSNIAKALGGNYRNRLEQVENILELVENTEEK